ncbi:aliphatic sulfonate ABC transporter substrate-binding protein [Paenibacillus pinisoli]|uniref:Putative aliphatic sulfonates-binding protein n=1 Tax=Paenibacillus pinisoli TaxID=1276110 RepID=A0A3A6PG89_9BACL|nr:aliphatic sulfonate ABC transporter substrate-binding protein [Paenibacillus pinisoli]RJX38706.1 aliphatic sulfonate ABC transporter substrate-binding protein [Paenibacillus pinisoli]
MKTARASLLILSALTALIVLAACGQSSSGNDPGQANNGSGTKSAEGVVVSIESSQIGPILIAKEKGYFEEEFAKFGATINYQPLQSSSQFLEGIAAGRLDFARIGYIGTITGQTAAIPFLSISEGSDGAGDGILVQQDSPIQSAADLKGKKIAVAKGSSSWGLILRALDKEGLKASDVEMINLQPDEAQSAFQSGKVDAWAVWEPARSNQVNNFGAKVIADSKSIGAYTPGYNIVRSKFAEEHPDLVVAYLKAYERALRWENENLDEAIALLAGLKKLDEETVRVSIANNVPLNLPISDTANESQQRTADILLELGEIKEQVDVTAVVDNTFITRALEELKAE